MGDIPAPAPGGNDDLFAERYNAFPDGNASVFNDYVLPPGSTAQVQSDAPVHVAGGQEVIVDGRPLQRVGGDINIQHADKVVIINGNNDPRVARVEDTGAYVYDNYPVVHNPSGVVIGQRPIYDHDGRIFRHQRAGQGQMPAVYSTSRSGPTVDFRRVSVGNGPHFDPNAGLEYGLVALDMVLGHKYGNRNFVRPGNFGNPRLFPCIDDFGPGYQYGGPWQQAGWRGQRHRGGSGIEIIADGHIPNVRHTRRAGPTVVFENTQVGGSTLPPYVIQEQPTGMNPNDLFEYGIVAADMVLGHRAQRDMNRRFERSFGNQGGHHQFAGNNNRELFMMRRQQQIAESQRRAAMRRNWA
jgi:hypothetical protein